MTLSEETLNHLLTGAVVLQIVTYPPGGLHITFENGAMLTVYAGAYGHIAALDVDIFGPSVLENPHVGRQVEVEP